VCSTEPRQQQELAYTLHLARNATRGSVVEVFVSFIPGRSGAPSGVLMTPGNEVRHALAVAVAEAPAPAAADEEPAELEAPMVPGLLLAAALLACAFALARRR
jgi:hypothetical protein